MTNQNQKQYITAKIELGSIVYTPEQQAAYKRRKESQLQKLWWRKMIGELGYFYFLASDNDLDKLSPATVARLIYLSTYLDYKNRFMLSQRRPLKKSDLEDILQLSKGAVFNFWHEVSPLYIVEDDNGLKLNNPDMVRGEIPKDDHNAYQRLYIESIRRLYRQTAPSHHKHLGYVFALIPLINIEYNILCYDKYEKDIDAIHKITVADFCQLINYDLHDYRKLLRHYRDITFEVDGHKEYFLSCVSQGDDILHAHLFINPRIIYCGSDYKKVEVLGAFTKAND